MNIVASITPNRTKFGPLLFAGELDCAFSSLAELGYQGVELSLRTKDDVDRRDLGQRLSAYGLRLFSIATGQSYVEDGLSLFAAADDVRTAAVGRICDLVDFASDWGSCVIVGGIRGKLEKANDPELIDKGTRAIDECITYAEKRKVTLLLEAINRYETNIFNTLGETGRFMMGRDSAYFRMLPDTFHMNIEEADIEKALEANKDRVGALHCADSNRLAPGMGHVDFSSIIKLIRSFPHIRYIGVEVLPLPDSRTCARTAIATINDALKECDR